MSSTNEPSVKPQSNTQKKLLKALFFILFYFISYAVWGLSIAISIFQFFYALLLKEPNKHLLDFSKNLNTYLYDIVRFISFNTETKPFPFSPWPK
jgi:hypothetical protein